MPYQFEIADISMPDQSHRISTRCPTPQSGQGTWIKRHTQRQRRKNTAHSNELGKSTKHLNCVIEASLSQALSQNGYGARKFVFSGSALSAGVRPLSSQIGPRQMCDGKRRRSNAIFFPPCWRALFLLLLWKYVKGLSPYSATRAVDQSREAASGPRGPDRGPRLGSEAWGRDRRPQARFRGC